MKTQIYNNSREFIKGKLLLMTDQQLRVCYRSLLEIDPTVFGENGWKEYWSKEYEITMEEWFDIVEAEMFKRKII